MDYLRVDLKRFFPKVVINTAVVLGLREECITEFSNVTLHNFNILLSVLINVPVRFILPFGR